MLEQEEMRNCENVGLTSREPHKTVEEMMIAIGDSLSNLASSENEDNGDDQDDEDPKEAMPSEDDEPG